MKMLKILGKRGRITIPFELRQRVGFACNDILSFTEGPDGQSVIVKRERICDDCGEERLCDTVSLFDFLNELTEEQQKAAFAHLGTKFAHRPMRNLYGRT